MPTTAGMSPARIFPRFFAWVAPLCAVMLIASTIPASAQSAPDAIPEADIDDLIGFTVIGNPHTDDDPWVDPVQLAGLDPDDLAPAPEFDLIEFHESTIFAAGVGLVPTNSSGLDDIVANHVRTLQVLATLDRDIDDLAAEIGRERPIIDRLIADIDHERTNEERLSEEISVLEEAVTEFALRAFIGEDDIEALGETNGSAARTRVVSDEVREDHFAQLEDRQTERAQRERQRVELQAELRSAREDLRELRDERLGLLQTRREIAELPDRTKATYHVALHERLPQFVEGSNIPLVALNAYVIAERTLAAEQPKCGITWSMLAGVGHIESFHGHFANSTLDINGHTTEDIHGLPLDGRILEGAEFLTNEDEAPDPTTRTEVLAVPQTPGDGEPPTEATPESPVEDEAAPDEAPSPESADPTIALQAPPEPPRVIRRLALIVDTDKGVLDGDTTFDRAVGPMQFIPSTWRLFEQDGNLDDEKDPQNIYDAALASARYLCASTPTMTTVEGELRAYFAYNHDEQYSQNVLQAGRDYAEIIEVAEPSNSDEQGEAEEDGNTDQQGEAEELDASAEPVEPLPSTTPLGLAEPDQNTIAADLARIQNQLSEIGLVDIVFE